MIPHPSSPYSRYPGRRRPISSRARCRLVHRRAGVRREKYIPSAVGWAGGSADAAAILRWAGRRERRVAPASVATCRSAKSGAARSSKGSAKRVDEPEFEHREVTLTLPDFGVRTAACYRAFDEL